MYKSWYRTSHCFKSLRINLKQAKFLWTVVVIGSSAHCRGGGHRWQCSLSMLLGFCYMKQTGPISMPNSWSVLPISTGARSMMGKRATFCVLYSKIVLPTFPFRFWNSIGKWVNGIHTFSKNSAQQHPPKAAFLYYKSSGLYSSGKCDTSVHGRKETCKSAFLYCRLTEVYDWKWDSVTLLAEKRREATKKKCSSKGTYRTGILKNGVSESNVSLSLDF